MNDQQPINSTLTSTPEPVVLVDGSSYLHRAYHALPPLKTSDGRPTGAIRGVASMVLRLRKDYPNSPLIFVLDAPGGTFRDRIYPEYKAHRERMDDELRAQIAPLRELIEAMGILLLCELDVEADDVIGTLALQARDAGYKMIISASDKDLSQLVCDCVTVIDSMSRPPTVLDEAGVQAKFGVPPARFVDYLALRGDSSDNIPGVPGVGEKSATALIQELGSLDDIYADTARVEALSLRGAKRLRQRLDEGRESAMLSRQLATIRTDVPLPLSLDKLPSPQPDQQLLLQLCDDLQLRVLAREFEAGLDSPPPLQAAVAVAVNWETVLSVEALNRWIERIAAAEIFALDTETTGLDPLRARLVGISLAVSAHEAAYIPFGHDYVDVPKQLTEQQVLAALKPLLEDAGRAKLGQNLKYDRSVFASHGIELAGIARDTMLESYVLNAGKHRHDMAYLAKRLLGCEFTSFEQVAGKGKKQLSFSQVRLEQATPYAAEDADVALQLDAVMWPQLGEQPRLRKLFEDVEMPLLPILSDMERQGVLVDPNPLSAQGEEMQGRLDALQHEIWELAGGRFNIASVKQLRELLFDEMKLPVSRKTPGGEAATGERVLQDLAAQGYPIAQRLLDYRHLDKLKSTYIDALPKQINPDTGRVHCFWHQAATSTGRLSSSGPNLQNIPIRTAEGRRIRQAFVAAPGYRLLIADYSQIELRIMAHISQDQSLLQAFHDGQDIHRATAAEIFGGAAEQVSSDQRRIAKMVNFGLIYGMSSFGLAQRLRINQGEAKKYIDTYFDRYPGVRDYMQNVRELGRKQGFVETLYGRRVHLPNIAGRGQQARAAERAAINAPMQGSAADIIKLAMIATERWLRDSGVPARLLMQVHDELVLEVQDNAADEVHAKLVSLMRAADQGVLDIPLEVAAQTGDNWDEAH